MGFKSVKVYNEERYGGFFLLKNDGDYADVIFLYQSVDDVLVADAHYIKSADYKGYCHCLGHGCPACAKGDGIRVQAKLFIPLFNIAENEIQFWDRNISFEPQLQNDVFSRYSNPSEFVFRITRHGASRDVNTTYEITAVGRNVKLPYQQILTMNKATFPDKYSDVIKDFSSSKLYELLNTPIASDYSTQSSMPEYSVTPRRMSSSVPTEVSPEFVEAVRPDFVRQDEVPEFPEYDYGTTVADSLEDVPSVSSADDTSDVDDVEF